MKKIKNFLRLLISAASIMGFLVGWATLAHSKKPVQPDLNPAAELQPLPTLVPITDQSSSNGDNGGLSIFVPSTQRRTSLSLFMTGGS